MVHRSNVLKPMIKKSLHKINRCIVLIPLLSLLSFPKQVYACACCANAGESSQTSQKISDFEFKEINRLQFSPKAKIL
ncbi:hypothetical protein NIES4071_30270 [Calothrix sp. NIES-4071]|nr:hypothetical protein NIES4071_30270 [Calothrix sp. NIES-4071]BAZ57347.1 hypothetical protein NIES4105_30210 [Calothrix sp. NIES-4105]